jgi:four helix bundle protein
MLAGKGSCVRADCMSDIKSFRDLLVWQKSMDLSVRIYQRTRTFSRDDQHSLGHQCRKSATSIPSNIAEGFSRHSTPTYINHLWIAHGSVAELETQLEIAKRIPVVTGSEGDRFIVDLQEIGKMINGLVRSLRPGP